MGVSGGKKAAGVLLLCIAALLFALAGCGKKDLSVKEYEAKLGKAGTVAKQLEILNGMADRHWDELYDRFSADLDPAIGKGLPDDLMIGTEDAEPVRVLPDSFSGKKWIALFDDAGTLRLNGNMYMHLPEEMRAKTSEEADAVLLLKHVEIPFDRTEGGTADLLSGTDPNGVRRTYAFYAAERGSGKTYALYSTVSEPSALQKEGAAPKLSARELWERAMYCIPNGRKHTLKEDEEYLNSLERPAEQLAALAVIAEAHAGDYSAADRGAELRRYIDAGNGQEAMLPFVPDFETSEWADPLPEKLADRKYLCLEIHTGKRGEETLYWRGGLYARLPERMRAETLEEADAVLIVHGYGTMEQLQGYYYINMTDHTIIDSEYVKHSETMVYDLTDGALYRTGWGDRDAEIWPAFCAALVPDAENAGLSAAGPAKDPFGEGKTYEAADTLLFGTYEQDGDPDDGPEPIEWIVLDVKDGELLLVSRCVLFMGAFHSVERGADWEHSDLHALLNGAFLDGAFGPEERKRILPADGGEVTLLSVEEVARYMPTRFSRVCERTPAADPKRSGDGHEKWWTRTVDDRGRVNEVSYRGDILTSGMDSENVGVRPVIRVDPAA